MNLNGINKGIWYAVAAYGLWGFLPVFWKNLQSVPAIEILAHRMAWSLVFLTIILASQRRWQWVRHVVGNRSILFTFLVSACVLSVNWFIYIWAVNSGHIVETSLGYFINPLVNVLLGVLFLRERLRPWQWTAVGAAAAGVLYLTITYGSLPWIALILAFSFGSYGLLRKTAALEALEGLSLETALLFLPAVAFLLYRELTGSGSFGHAATSTNLLLALSGVATALPLLWFAVAARRITLTTLGLVQYMAPTIQFLLGVFVYHEPFSLNSLVGFSLIWLALLIYSGEGVVVRHRRNRLPTVI